MTIDERLQFLLASTESLHASVQELHATVAEQARTVESTARRESQLRNAMLAGIRAFLEGLNGGEGT